ncbi:MAG: acyl-CoA thioesterase [Cyclobacteriaceae bacterium]|nr:acyl-CoA thioesterase [Cyclobacteriaceae bacterium]
MYSSETFVRVRYGETDQMGFVYYGAYAMYYEVGRVESLRQLGLTYKELEATGVLMPVLENYSKYIAPARYDENLRIITQVKERPTARIRFHYEIYNETDKLINIGETQLVFLNKKTGGPLKYPEMLSEVLDPFFSP